MKFTIRQLAYFIAAGETGSITLASERTNISQPSISTAISHLERELRVQLFVRHHAQGLSLTPAGRRLLREAKQVLKQAEGLYSSTDDSEPLRGSLSIGCLVTLAPMVMPELCYSFMKAFPGVEIRPQEDHQEGLLEALRRADIELAVTYDLQISRDITFAPLVTLPAYAVFGASDPLHSRTTVTLKELAERPMILLDLPISRDYFLALFLREGLQPHIWWHSPHQEVVRTMVANGYGYTLFNARPKSDVALDGRRLFRVKLAGEHPPAVLGLATLGQLKKSRLMQTFERHCRELISNEYIPGMVGPDIERKRRRPRQNDKAT
jgi:DNA-binding transcriptional LysR family regulator